MKQLFSEFEPTSAEAWKLRLEKDLKGITFEALSLKDRNEIIIRPFYTKEDSGNITSITDKKPGWSICEHIIVEDAATANKQALEALNNGASGLCFTLKNEVAIPTLLHEIELPYIYTLFKIKEQEGFPEKLKLFLDSKNWDLKTLDCFIDNDFIHSYLQTGEWIDSFEQDSKRAVKLIETTGQININASLFHNAGTNSTTELGYTLALLNEYLTLLNTNQKTALLTKIQITLATDTNFYEQIAKLRALRNGIELLLAQYNLNIPLHLHVETSYIYRSTFDSYSNLLRDTLAGMAAILGGCDSLYIHPFDETGKASVAFSTRMSRNQQLIFKEESYLDKVSDAAAGSYYIESLTESFSQNSWDIFKVIETTGGIIASFDAGIISERITSQANTLILEYKEGKRVLVGVNKYPNSNDVPHQTPMKSMNSKGIQPILLSNEIL